MASPTGTIFTLTIPCPTRTDAPLPASPFLPLHLRSKASQEPAMISHLGGFSCISQALYRDSGPVQDMGVYHGGRDIRMSQQFLDCPDVIVRFKQMRGKGVAQTRRFCNGSKIYLFDLGEADPPWPITSNYYRTGNQWSYCKLWILEVNR